MEADYGFIDGYINEFSELLSVVSKDQILKNGIREAIILISDCFDSKNKVLVAGNGGSAADAQHFAAEFVGHYKLERKAYPTIALTTDTSILTAWSNDYKFDTVFSRQIEAIGNTGDIFFGISTSGNSKNIIEGIKRAKEKGLKTICLLGRSGGAIKGMPDISLIVPSFNTPRIQEVHTMVLHIICEEIEKRIS